MNNDLLLFIFEGEEREADYLSAVDKHFFSLPKNAITVFVPAEMNIYMLYSVIKEDGFFTDIIEILRERNEKAKTKLVGYTRDDFAGVYLFFDFDEHSNNLGLMSTDDYCQVLKELVEFFDDPSDVGKLYISYPMIEALRDRCFNSCQTYSGDCLVSRDEFTEYKNASANPLSANVGKYSFKEWRDSIVAFSKRCCCLMRIGNIDRDNFLQEISQMNILQRELQIYMKTQSVFVLSSIPCFLLEYSQRNWDSTLGKTHRVNLLNGCSQKSKLKLIK